MCKGAFTNYVDKILAFFDHLHTFVDIFYGMNVDKKWIFKATYLPCLVNVFCEQPLTWLYVSLLRSLEFFIGKGFSRPYEKIRPENVIKIHFMKFNLNFHIHKFNKRLPLCLSKVLWKIDIMKSLPFSRFHWSYTMYFLKYLYKYLLPVRVLFNGPLLNFNFFCFSKKSLPCS